MLIPAAQQEAILVASEEEADGEVDNDDWSFDDDDFWNALDLMETSYKMIRGMLANPQIIHGRRRVLENHADDLRQFLDEFPAEASHEAEGGDAEGGDTPKNGDDV